MSEQKDIPLTGCPLATSLTISVSVGGDKNQTVLHPDVSNNERRGIIVCLAEPVPRQTSPVYAKKGDVTASDEKGGVTIPTDVDSAVSGMIENHVNHIGFTGKEGQTASITLPSNVPFHNTILVGLGKDTSTSLYASIAGDAIGKSIEACKLDRAVLWIEKEMTPTEIESLLTGIIPSLVSDNRFRSSSKENIKINYLHIHLPKSLLSEETFTECIARSRVVSQGVQLAKELVAAPANYCTTVAFARTAINIGMEGQLESRVLGPSECESLGMTSFLAVARGSSYPAQLVHLVYRSADVRTGSPALRKIGVVGKGIMMDTGGYNLKGSQTIDYMKIDMGGGAAVLGAALAISALRPSGLEIHFIIPCAENMISSSAYRPGDVITAMNGKTIEVQNTDAEGRLILCDALCYAQLQGIDELIDCATLTGACMVALGDTTGGVYSNDINMQQTILNCAQTAGESMWGMPLNKRMRHMIDSKIADITNLPISPYGGSISAALFLNDFVDPSIKWAHIDMAGPVFSSKTRVASGFAVRTLTKFILNEST
eukprot:GHVO01032241.1.p1 GENE.GHVO01032241.1~~GHVO01032241.1.p1  ORF type:complete len:544 (+),score=103.36 GHVO01032241.1:28-1659(+)